METIHKKRTLGKPRTRCKDTVEKNVWMVEDSNVPIELALDGERWRGLLVATQVLQVPLSCRKKKKKKKT